MRFAANGFLCCNTVRGGSQLGQASYSLRQLRRSFSGAFVQRLVNAIRVETSMSEIFRPISSHRRRLALRKAVGGPRWTRTTYVRVVAAEGRAGDYPSRMRLLVVLDEGLPEAN